MNGDTMRKLFSAILTALGTINDRCLALGYGEGYTAPLPGGRLESLTVAVLEASTDDDLDAAINAFVESL